MSYLNETVSSEKSDHEAHLATTEIFFKQLVVAIDFAKPLESTLMVAAEIAQLFNAKVFLVHAITPPMYQIDGQIITQQVLLGDVETCKEDIKKLIDCSEELKKLQPEIRIEHSEPVDFIVRVAHEIGADLIVVGSHGASGLERLALGSTAEAVLRRAQCPVLIVGSHYYARKHPFRSIVFATDLSSTGLRGAQYASGLAERFHAQLTLLHAMDPRCASPDPAMETLRERAMEQLRRLLPHDIDQYCKSRIRLEYGKPADIICAVTRSEAASLLVIGLRDHALGDHDPWSTLAHIIPETTCPILGVRGHLV